MHGKTLKKVVIVEELGRGKVPPYARRANILRKTEYYKGAKSSMKKFMGNGESQLKMV